MKRFCLIVALSVCFHCGQGHAMAVFDGSDLAQNLISAQEAVQHTQRMFQQLQTQMNQYKRMLQDAMNPGQFAWGDIQNTIDQLKNTMQSLTNLAGFGGA